MKSFVSILTLAGLAATAPLQMETSLVPRQLVGIIADDLTGVVECRDVTFIFARGSTEIGNMGTIVGPPVANGLKSRLGASKVAVQGVNYAALLSTNFIPQGGDPLGIIDMRKQFETAVSRCPSTKIVAGGYSQGAAIVHEAVEALPANIKDKIAGIVTFGDTRNLQDNGQIKGFPQQKLKIICAFGDLVCSGTLIITPAHLTYGANANEAVDFLVGRINAAN